MVGGQFLKKNLSIRLYSHYPLFFNLFSSKYVNIYISIKFYKPLTYFYSFFKYKLRFFIKFYLFFNLFFQKFSLNHSSFNLKKIFKFYNNNGFKKINVSLRVSKFSYFNGVSASENKAYLTNSNKIFKSNSTPSLLKCFLIHKYCYVFFQ